MYYVQLDLFGKVGVGKTTIYNLFAGDKYMQDGGNLCDDFRVYYRRCWVFPRVSEHYMCFLSDPVFEMRWKDLQFKFLKKMFEPTNVIYIVTDSTPEDVEAVKNSLNLYDKLKRGLIIFVIANKQDLPDAVPVEKIKEILGINDVYGLSALSPDAKEIMEKALRDGLNRYLLMLTKRGERLELVD